MPRNNRNKDNGKSGKTDVNRRNNPRDTSAEQTSNRLFPDGVNYLNVVSRIRETNLGTKLKVRHHLADEGGFGNLNQIQDQIIEVINNFSTERGYVTSTTFDVVQTYVNRLISVTMGALALVRTQNLVKLRDVNGELVGEAFYSFAPKSAAPTAEYLFNNWFSTPQSYMNDDISNHKFAVEFQTPMSFVLTTPYLMNSLIGLISPVHKSHVDEDDELFDVVWPDQNYTYGTLKLAIDQLLGMLSTYPDLGLILRSLGFATMSELGFEFQRDKFQDIIHIRRDGFFENILANSKVELPYNIGVKDVTPKEFITNATYPDTFLRDINNSLTLIDDVDGTVNIVDKEAYIISKLFARPGSLTYLGFTRLGYYNFQGHTRTKTLHFIWSIFAIPYRLDTGVIDSGGGYATGTIDRDWTMYKCNIERISMGTVMPDLENTLLEIKKGLTTSDNFALYVNVYTYANSASVWDTGLKVGVSNVGNGEYYINMTQPYLIFGIVE